MGLCLKCRKFLPPQLMNSEKLCLFCEIDKDVIVIRGNQLIKKEKVVKDYQIFLKIVKEKNDILKNALKDKDALNMIPHDIIDTVKFDE